MKKVFLFSLLTMFFSFTQVAFADAANELSQLLNPLRTMQSNFTQVVLDDHGKTLQRSYGRMSLLRPGKFKWEVTKPTPQLIVTNGTRLWIYDKDLQQVTVRAFNTKPGDTPALLLSQDNMALNNDYRVNKMPQSKNDWQWYSLKSKDKDNMFQNVQMGFLNKQLKQMRLEDHLGHDTTIQFANAKFNTPLSASAFEFKAPRNVDVIDETRKKR